MTVSLLDLIPSRHILHLNTRSIRGDKIDELLARFTGTQFNALTISESWLHSNDHEVLYEIPGYNLYRSDRIWSDIPGSFEPKVGGGLLTYINRKVKSSSDELLSFNKSTINMECLCITTVDEKKKSVICNIYRPPEGDMNIFIDELETLVEDILELKISNMYFLGDFNIDLLDVKLIEFSGKLQNMMLQHGFMNYIKSITRYGENGDKDSCLDLIFTNVNDIEDSGIIAFDLSDHEMVYITAADILQDTCETRRSFLMF